MLLNTFLKTKGVAPTGGQVKHIIRSEAVKVNGEIETRNKYQLKQGDVVEWEENKWVIELPST